MQKHTDRIAKALHIGLFWRKKVSVYTLISQRLWILQARNMTLGSASVISNTASIARTK